MLSLYIQGKRVNLPEDFQTEYYIKSPYFTNQGDYTLNIELNLMDPTNAMVYSYLHRIDRTQRQGRREAILQDETGVLIRGEEVVLEINEHKASIQIVGGVSELNFHISDKKIQDLELWYSFASDEVEYFPVLALNNSDYADHGLITGDKIDRSGETAVLRWRVMNPASWNQNTHELSISYDIPQPYFWAIIEHVITALGFTVESNIIKTDARFSKMVMVHAINSSYIAEILPNWTVSALFEEYQKFFNVLFVVNQRTRGVSVVSASNFYNTNNREVVDKNDIVGEISKSFDSGEEMTMQSYGAVHYAFTDQLLNKYSALDEKLLDTYPPVNITGDSGNQYAKIWENSANGAFFRQAFAGENRLFVIWPITEDIHLVKMVNMFGAKTSRLTTNEVELKIVPVRMASSSIQGWNGSWWQYPLPAVDGEAATHVSGGTFGGAALEPSDPYAGVNEAIVKGMKKENEKRTDVIFAAFFFGNVPINWEASGNNLPNTIWVPVASPDYQVQVMTVPGSPAPSDEKLCARHVILGSTPLTMAITGNNGMDAYTYSNNLTVDTSVAYKIKFVSGKRKDVNKMWVVGNRLFYCKELKYSIHAGKRSEVVEGTFYPMVANGTNEAGETVYYVTYDLSRVVASPRTNSVPSGSSLELTLTASGGGNASASLHVTIWMGGVVVQNAYTADIGGRKGTISIASVTGDVQIQAGYY